MTKLQIGDILLIESKFLNDSGWRGQQTDTTHLNYNVRIKYERF